MKRTTLSMIALVAVFGCLGLSSTWANDGNSTATVGAPAPSFTLEDQAGKVVNLSDFAGKVVVLEWINPDCPYVQRHYNAKTMKTLAEKYSSQGVVWLAVNTTHYMTKETNKEWISKHQLPYAILDDHEGKIGHLYDAKTTPHMFIINKDGVLVYKGAIDDDRRGDKTEKVNYVEKALNEVLAGKAVSVPETVPYGCSMKFAK